MGLLDLLLGIDNNKKTSKEESREDRLFLEECKNLGLTKEEMEECKKSGITPEEWAEENDPNYNEQ